MNIESIVSAAALVATEYAASEIAHETVADGETELLQRVVDAAKPALRAISTRRRLAQRNFWVDVCQETEFTRGPAALRVVGDGAEYDYPGGNSGSYEGVDLFLTPDGTWTRAVYTGVWSRWQGASSHWECMDTTLTTRQVVASYHVDDIIKAIGDALTRAVGSREKSTKAAIERAEKLSAVAKLVKP